MAALIGVVSKVIGQVFAVAGNGTRRAVVEGDRLYAGDTLDTGASGALAVHLTNGNELTLGRGSSLALTPQLLSDQPPSIVVQDQSAPSASQLTEVEQLQQAIAAGQDPTQSLEATAAGPAGVYTNTPAGDLGGGHSFVLLTETGGSVSPVVGFDTAGLASDLIVPAPVINDQLLVAADDTTVVPPVIVPPDTTPPDTTPLPTDNGITFVDLYRDGGEQRVYEADLPQGTNTAQGVAGDLSRTDTFSVIAPDGLASLTIDGVQVVSNGALVANTDAGTVEIVGQLGNTLTITNYNATTGVFEYTYVLSVAGDNNQTISNLELSEDFHLIAADTDGDSGDAWLNVRITDDSPIANNDSDSVSETTTLVTGNVLGNDYVGADSNASPVSLLAADNPSYVLADAQTLVGKYGTLTLAADGTFSYQLDTSDPDYTALKFGDPQTTTPEVFTYTITDGDGDVAKASITIDVGYTDHAVTINWLNSSGGDLIFTEADLPDGSNTKADKADWLTDHSSFYVDAKDGLSNLTVGGVSVVSNGVAATFPVEITGQWGNLLSITNVNLTTGQVDYTYTVLVTSPNNVPGSGDALADTQLSDDFQIVANDTDDDSDTAWINIIVKDDTPTAVGDENAVDFSNQSVSANVTSNDVIGADTNATPVSISAAQAAGVEIVNATTLQGLYGTLVLAADGQYTYTLDTTSAAYQALTSSQSATETFSYTLTDGDGDSSQANLQISVAGSDHEVAINLGRTTLVAEESNLPGGSTYVAGSGDDHVQGSLTVTALDGLQTLVVGGVTVVENGQKVDLSNAADNSVTTPEGNTFKVIGIDLDTGVVQYEYIMNGALDHAAEGDGTTITEQFNVVATDADGSSSSATLEVQVLDDNPQAGALAQTTDVSTATGTNIMLVIDISNSMKDWVEAAGETRLQLAKDAIDQMLQQYAELGDVKVLVTTFNSTGQLVSDGWVDVATAIDLVNGLQADAATNYDAALATAQSAYLASTAGMLTGDSVQTVSYFVSDGNPTLSSQVDHVTDAQSDYTTDTDQGDGIDVGEEALWTSFLTEHGIKSYVFGIGDEPLAQYLDPVAFDGSSPSGIGTNTEAVLVSNITDLPEVLLGTVAGKPVSGSLLDAGGFGADGGFVKSITVDGVQYSIAADNTLIAGEGAKAGDSLYDASSHELMVKTAEGGALKVDMLTGDYTYAPPSSVTAASFTETVLFTLSDNDGDTASSALTVNVLVDAPLTASAENIITNIATAQISVPVAALLANAAAGTEVSGSTTFDTGLNSRGADFTASSSTALDFSATSGSAARLLEISRSQFTNSAALMTAALLVSGYLGAATELDGNSEDTLTLSLKKGETVHLSSSLDAAQASIVWAAADGNYSSLDAQGNFTASADGVYSVHLSNSGATAESYTLDITVDYANADSTALGNQSYSVVDSDGHSATAAITAHYQAGAELVGTSGNDVLIGGDDTVSLSGGAGDDVLVAGDGGNQLSGGSGDDLLISGAGADVLDGGAGNDTASYQNSSVGMSVSLLTGEAHGLQGTTGLDKLISIENLIGSDHDDVLIGDAASNVLTGGKGDDTLTGGGGSDTFKWLAGDTGHDTITDFQLGGDTLDLSQLLKGETSVASSLDDFLQFKVIGSGDGAVSTIEVSSVANGSAVQTITLDHVDVASTYGVQVGSNGLVASGQDTATIISGMLNDHSLKADTV